MAVFKVFYQENLTDRIIREDTSTKYFEAESESEVRRILSDSGYNIEFIEELSDAHLNYEKENNSQFKVENL
ncbi:DNA-dependent RNA polymerase subunit epsilon [Salinicoccus halitifaciens]|uniref:DNA-directed RNA polymerase subunit epsilon n=1 Tax=Salinicoccus halitifaciens TaxID=1073415 RepID=A0ABV2E7L6_9STAP|nr:DNA-dependent RNA polymerase auxiliary subunit epsilon family protein [Salinicoccus halitifaciens]MCD2136521.1 DNA-dependent RNA polymerase auxiliary subunit epsilon family protein [Salinicoccus halitifaciens]